MNKNLLLVKFIDNLKINTPLREVSEILEKLEENHIVHSPWSSYHKSPRVNFSIAFSLDGIFLKFRVLEDEVLAFYTKCNDPVYKDSCVEFFIAFNKDPYYYNLEFNSLGTILGGYGKDSVSRILLSKDLLQQIKKEIYLYHLEKEKGYKIKWEITLVIPFDVFRFHTSLNLIDKTCQANFYKCADDSINPHFLCWNLIKSKNPDFHLPEYFGDIRFMRDSLPDLHKSLV